MKKRSLWSKTVTKNLETRPSDQESERVVICPNTVWVDAVSFIFVYSKGIRGIARRHERA